MGMKDAIPVIFAATLLQELKNELVFGKVATQKHSGEIKEKGDRIKLKGYGGVTINDYDPDTALSYEKPHAAAMFLDIDQAKDYAVELPDISELQSDPASRQHYAEEAAYGLKDEVDDYIAALYSQSAYGTHVMKSTAIKTSIVTSYIGELWTKLNGVNVKKKWIVIPPWVALKLLLAGVILAHDLKGELKNGFLGRVLQFDMYMSNNCTALTPVTAGYSRHVIMAGSYQAIAFADQMTESESLRSIDQFSDLIRGLHVWGAKVVKPKELFYNDFEFAPETEI